MQKAGFFLAIICVIGLTACTAVNQVSPEISPDVDQYVDTEGVNVRFKISGSNNKPALLLLHGFTSSLDTWDYLVAELKNDYQLIRFDFPGHGLTGPHPRARYGHEDRVELVIGVIDRLKLSRPSLIGNSMGGNTAWRTASQYPDLIDKLILIDASGFPMNGLADTPIAIPPAMEAYLRHAPTDAVTYGVARMFADPLKIPQGRIETIIEMMQQAGNGEALVKTFENFTLPEPTVLLQKITTPTLILWGAKDVIVPPDHATLFEQAIPNSTVVMLEDVGHVAQEEAPALTATILKEFLRAP